MRGSENYSLIPACERNLKYVDTRITAIERTLNGLTIGTARRATTLPTSTSNHRQKIQLILSHTAGISVHSTEHLDQLTKMRLHLEIHNI